VPCKSLKGRLPALRRLPTTASRARRGHQDSPVHRVHPLRTGPIAAAYIAGSSTTASSASCWPPRWTRSKISGASSARWPTSPRQARSPGTIKNDHPERLRALTGPPLYSAGLSGSRTHLKCRRGTPVGVSEGGPTLSRGAGCSRRRGRRRGRRRWSAVALSAARWWAGRRVPW